MQPHCPSSDEGHGPAIRGPREERGARGGAGMRDSPPPSMLRHQPSSLYASGGGRCLALSTARVGWCHQPPFVPFPHCPSRVTPPAHSSFRSAGSGETRGAEMCGAAVSPFQIGESLPFRSTLGLSLEGKERNALTQDPHRGGMGGWNGPPPKAQQDHTTVHMHMVLGPMRYARRHIGSGTSSRPKPLTTNQGQRPSLKYA